MKFIEKQQEPQAYTDWKALANDNWQPSYDDLSGDPKKALKDALMVEQGHLCCYCECRLTDNDAHIEHFRPQSDPTVDPLDYSNMLCSCQDQLKKAEPRHCGNQKGDWFDDALLVSPLDPEGERRFSFTGDGNIQPKAATDHAAIETINRLSLDIPKLNALRASAIEPFLEASLREEELQQFVTAYLHNNESGLYGEFWTTIHCLFGGYVTA